MPRCREHIQIDGQVLTNSRSCDLLADVQGAGLILGVNDTELFPQSVLAQFGMGCLHQSVAQKETAEGFAAAGGTRDADLQLGKGSLRLLDLDSHDFSSM